MEIENSRPFAISPRNDASDWSCPWETLLQPIRNTTQLWVVTRHQYGISALVPASRKSRLFSRLKGFEKYFSFTFFTGFLLVISCGIYPSGWGSVEFKQVCGDEANFYKLGHCKLSWAFFVYVSGTGIAFMCAALSARVAKQRKPLYIRTDVERSNSFM